MRDIVLRSGPSRNGAWLDLALWAAAYRRSAVSQVRAGSGPLEAGLGCPADDQLICDIAFPLGDAVV